MANLHDTIKRIALGAIRSSKPVEILYGKVISADPIKINIEQRLTLDESFLVLTRNVVDYKTEMSFDDPLIKNEVTIYNGLKNGDMVILQRIQGGQKFIVLDKI